MGVTEYFSQQDGQVSLSSQLGNRGLYLHRYPGLFRTPGGHWNYQRRPPQHLQNRLSVGEVCAGVFINENQNYF